MKTIDHATFTKQRKRAEQTTEVVHLFDKSEPHAVNGDPCWCDPGIEDFRANGGGILIVHTSPVWQ